MQPKNALKIGEFMQKILQSLLCILFLAFTNLYGNTTFGYISYSTPNIGDDIQAIAAKRFLPKNCVPIDREFIGIFTSDVPVKTIVNGWFMHTKNFGWYRTDVPAPEKSWPPADAIDPLLISIYITDQFAPTALSPEGIEYFKKHGPVGARDFTTLALLQQQGIPSYFSGCLTLTLENTYTNRNDVIYAVDLDDECLAYLKEHTHSKVRVITHSGRFFSLLDNEKRLLYAERLLNKYRQAKCVVTSRLHATMPCLAIETPVLLVHDKKDPRFQGLRELARNCDREEFLQGNFNFNFDDPQTNPTAYLSLRKKLIETVTAWVKKQPST